MKDRYLPIIRQKRLLLRRITLPVRRKAPTSTTEPSNKETQTEKKRTSSKKNFSNYKDKLGDVEFVSIQDFLAYKIGFGDLVFEKSKKNGLEALMSRERYGKLLYKQGTDIDRGSKAKIGSLPISEFYDWLESNKDVPAVKEYLATLEGMSEADKKEGRRKDACKDYISFWMLKEPHGCIYLSKSMVWNSRRKDRM